MNVRFSLRHEGEAEVAVESAQSKGGREATFQEGFSMLARRVEGTTLRAELINAHCGEIEGWTEIPLKEVAEMEDMSVEDTS